MEDRIRRIKEEEYIQLEDFLYEAIFVPEGEKAPDRSIVRLPELQIYIEGFGKRKDDHCLVAEVDGKLVGAVWVRIMNDYGHVEDDTPSMAISLYKEYRGLGIGTQLMKEMLTLLKEQGYQKVSLSVQKENYAYQMYLKLGFQVIDITKEEYIMICNLWEERDI